MNWKAGAWLLLLSTLLASASVAGELILIPSRDNTLYEPIQLAGNGEIPPSNGAGDYFFAGATLIGGEVRRGLLAFDFASAIPAGSVISSVTLTLQMSRTISGPSDVTLHRVSSDWGEGTSDAPGQEGIGAPATPGDATWFHTFYPGGLWASTGGDFSPTASASQTVDVVGSYTWGSTDLMVADVQSWIDDPSTNFGWLVMGDELAQPSAKRFNTRENGSGAPQLAVTFQAPVPATPTWVLVMLAGILGYLALWRLKRSRQEVSC